MLCLAIRYTDDIVVQMALLKVGVCPSKFAMRHLGVESDATTCNLEDLFQRYTGVDCIADCTLWPGGIDQLVTIARILCNLFRSSCTSALQSDGHLALWIEARVHEIFEGNRGCLLDGAIDCQSVPLGVDALGNTAMIADKVVLIGCNCVLDEGLVICFTIVRKGEDMRHGRGFFLQDSAPGIVWHLGNVTPEGFMIGDPPLTKQQWIALGKWLQLELCPRPPFTLLQ